MTGTGTAVVIPCYTEERWDTLVAAVGSATDQTVPTQVIVVVDHNPGLAARLRSELARKARPAAVIENEFSRGVSGARNTGVLAARSDLVAFMDDDTVADPTWLERLVGAVSAEPTAVGAGGGIAPSWADGMPGWLPEEFLWTVGVTRPGQGAGPVRNVWGANMLVRRDTFLQVGGFCETFGKIGEVPEPEDTELCLRMNAHAGVQRGWLFAPRAIVRHHVPRRRVTWSYFLRRCWAEGAGKALLAARPDRVADPGAQLRITDADGLRVTGFLTNTAHGGPHRQLADLELRHRCHARVEDRIRAAKDTGTRNLPFHDRSQNRIWLAITALAGELLAHTARLALPPAVALYEPKRMRLRILATAGRLVRTARRTVVHIDPTWPWTDTITTAHTRLRALPVP